MRTPTMTAQRTLQRSGAARRVDPKLRHPGARGIAPADEWSDFLACLAHENVTVAQAQAAWNACGNDIPCLLGHIGNAAYCFVAMQAALSGNMPDYDPGPPAPPAGGGGGGHAAAAAAA
ncbi:MAG: hypothetical protein H6739_10840 [Alphaproteobacteria bacterium]|nr:hypothetical protein [Alphaproteobacteria bacterium]